MGHQNTPRTYQMLPIKQEEGYSCHIPLGRIGDYPDQHKYPVVPSSHQMVDLKPEQGYSYFYQPSGNIANYPNQYTVDQVYHPSSSFESSGATSYSVSNTCVLPSSRSYFPPENNGFVDRFAHSADIATGDEYHFADNHRVHHKRKHPEMAVGNYYTANEPAYQNLSSENIYLNSGQLQRVGPNGEIHSMNSKAFTSHGYIETGNLPTTNGFHGTATSSSHAISPRPQTGFSHTSCMVQSFQPSNVGFVEHPGYYNWNFSCGMSSINGNPGECSHPGAMKSMSMHCQEHPDASFNRNSAFVVHPSSSFNHQQHLPPVPGMQIPGSCQPFSNLQTSNAYPFTNVDPTSTFPGLYRPISEVVQFPAFPGASHLENSEDEEEVSDYYSSQDVDDWHGDALLDVDHMSYEELLALGEHIGHVCTGLSEDSILKNLKTSVWAPQLSLSLSDISSQPAEEICVICLDEYTAHDRIGNLDCGHSYHADCIKQWLLIKNLCPTCREPALAT